jgi:hypothetical protein
VEVGARGIVEEGCRLLAYVAEAARRDIGDPTIDFSRIRWPAVRLFVMSNPLELLGRI